MSIFLLVYILIRMMTYIKFKQINKELIYKKAKTDSHFMESLYGIQTIKSLSLNSIRKEYWLSLFINSINISVQNQKYSSFFEAVEGITAAVNEITILGIGVYMVMDNTLTLGMFIAFNVYRSIFIENISAFINDFVALRMLSIHYDRISDIALTNIEKNNDIPLFSCNFSEKSNNQEIILKIENITYGYDHLPDPILNKISLSIRKNDIVAIVGPSGCGKTTLIKIMSGLLYPNQGNVIYNGTNIKQMGYPNYRDNIALVLQEDHLFSGSLLMNIACFDKNIDMDWVVECAHVANIHDDIINMPMGYGTIIGELGQGLSGGQKQRILLARSLYKKPKILFLDESTSHLDVKNEAIINANIMNLDITRVVVAHRESTINYAKNIIDLSNYR